MDRPSSRESLDYIKITKLSRNVNKGLSAEVRLKLEKCLGGIAEATATARDEVAKKK